MWSGCCALLLRSLREQHEIDLQVYRDGHQNVTNRILHWLLIPVEIITFLVLVDRLVLLLLLPLVSINQPLKKKKNSRLLLVIQSRTIAQATNVTLGILSFFLVSPLPDAAGLAALCLHGLLFAIPLILPKRIKQNQLSMKRVVAAWTLSWLLQICLGHWILEGNAPTFFQSKDGVSFQAVATSVLIAWKS